eukprot:5764363-Pleurochrysis_carterae.AAC.1
MAFPHEDSRWSRSQQVSAWKLVGGDSGRVSALPGVSRKEPREQQRQQRQQQQEDQISIMRRHSGDGRSGDGRSGD